MDVLSFGRPDSARDSGALALANSVTELPGIPDVNPAISKHSRCRKAGRIERGRGSDQPLDSIRRAQDRSNWIDDIVSMEQSVDRPMRIYRGCSGHTRQNLNYQPQTSKKGEIMMQELLDYIPECERMERT